MTLESDFSTLRQGGSFEMPNEKNTNSIKENIDFEP